jgi:hypothetical protein
MKKRLSLKKITMRDLDVPQLGDVAGGYATTTITQVCPLTGQCGLSKNCGGGSAAACTGTVTPTVCAAC